MTEMQYGNQPNLDIDLRSKAEERLKNIQMPSIGIPSEKMPSLGRMADSSYTLVGPPERIIALVATFYFKPPSRTYRHFYTQPAGKTLPIRGKQKPTNKS